MNVSQDDANSVEQLLDTPNLADALESDRFKQFLDHVPFAIAVSQLREPEQIIYANIEFERLIGLAVADIDGRPWDVLPKSAKAVDTERLLSAAIGEGEDFIGTFSMEKEGNAVTVDAWSNIIQNDDGTPMFRLVAISENRHLDSDKGDLEKRVWEKDTQLRELQHRVKNNLQMITALIRLEARNVPDGATGEQFDRLAGRINSLALLYRSLSDGDPGDTVDLGIYLSQIASAVMSAHASEGIRLDLKVDTWPVSVNVAMPTGLVVNELLTNTLKHAFVGREGGTITLHSLVDETGCRVIVSDDGNGLAEGGTWPAAGKLSALIVQSLRQNAKAQVDFTSAPGKGVRVTIFFARANAAPD